MLRSVLSPEVYLSDDILGLEQERVFRNMWIFAGLRSSLSTRNAFFTRNMGGVPIVITTPDGQAVHAFENLCAHRQMPIQHAAFGKRSLVCPYHAWSYTTEDGCLKGVAGAHLYEMRASEKEQFKLRQFAVEVVGNMIFVNLSPTPQPIDSQFSAEFLSEVKVASEHFDSTFAYSTFDVGYNWKFNFENVIDYNHVPYIHANSFAAMMATSEVDPNKEMFPADVDWDRQESQRNHVGVQELSYASIGDVNMKAPWFRDLVRRFGERDAYYNWYVYPNVNFASVGGDLFLIQQYMPIAPNRTQYHLWMVTSERLSRRQDFTALLRGLMESEKKVIDEDSVLLESMQANLHASAPPMMHGAYEYRLFRMAKWYRENIMTPL
jgi:phenylpropionate dioxygenase-like ring-hydroxylating dioxygenase large terminal subunit